MKEPTEAQIKEFWEGYGLEESLGYFYHEGMQVFESRNSINLNNLFKYAVLPLLDKNKNAYYRIIVAWHKSLMMHKEDPALALFWALWEVKENKV